MVNPSEGVGVEASGCELTGWADGGLVAGTDGRVGSAGVLTAGGPESSTDIMETSCPGPDDKRSGLRTRKRGISSEGLFWHTHKDQLGTQW